MRPKRYRKSSNTTLERAVRSMDDLAAFEDFRREILPALQADVQKGLSATEILKKYEAVAAAKMVSALVGLTGTVAAKDILDRQLGKAIERKELRHRLDELPENEVDALLLSKMKDVGPVNDEE